MPRTQTARSYDDRADDRADGGPERASDASRIVPLPRTKSRASLDSPRRLGAPLSVAFTQRGDEREQNPLSLAMPNLSPHTTLFLAEFPSAFATFLNTHTLLISSRVRSHNPSHGANYGGENLVRAFGSEQ